jgi:hypothetical protein
MSNIFKVTLIDSRGSSTRFQCFDGFSEVVARASGTIERNLGLNMESSIIRVFVFSVETGELKEFQPQEIRRLELQRLAGNPANFSG